MKQVFNKLKILSSKLLDLFFDIITWIVIFLRKAFPVIISFIKVVAIFINDILSSVSDLLIKMRIHSKKSVVDEDDLAVDDNYFIENRSRMKATISAMLLVFIVMGVYLYFSIEKRVEYDEVIEHIEPVTIEVPHPNDEMNIDDYESVEYKVKRGDNFASILVDFGIDDQQIADSLSVLKKVYNLRRLNIGQIIHIKYRVRFKNSNSDENGVEEYRILDELVIQLSSESDLVLFRNDEGKFEAKEVSKELTKYMSKYKGDINNSLFEDGLSLGVPANIMIDLIRLYSFDVDFQRDIRKGDKFEVLFEAYYNEDGEKIRDGNILYSKLTLRGEELPMYRFTQNEGGAVLYFDKNGKSVQKSLLRTPINGARLSSGYGMRKHPILGYNKMHQGIDFAARTGTPFFAAGDGVVTMRKWYGGFGNYIRIRHNSEYSTEYAHISKFKSDVKVGTRVKQGQVIAYVGTTGRSTGPHLHYGMIYRGKRVNPNKVKTTPSKKLQGSELVAFDKVRDDIEKYRANTPLQNNYLIN